MATLSNFFGGNKEEKPPSDLKPSIPQQSAKSYISPAGAAAGLPELTKQVETKPAQPQTPPQANKNEAGSMQTPSTAPQTPPPQGEKRSEGKSTRELFEDYVRQVDEKQLMSMADYIETEIRHRSSQKREATLEKVRALLAESGMSMNELVTRERKPKSMGEKIASGRSIVKPKFNYPMPDGTRGTWSGRGKTPTALKALLDGGKKLDEYAIKE